jgi:hypothetical protein
MTFKRAVEQTPSISCSYCSGLQALTATDRERITPRNSKLLAGSLNLDDALKDKQPNAPRWDYGIGVRRSRRKSDSVLWIDVHPASSDHNRAEIMGKLDWLKSWLKGEGRRLGALNRSFTWIASGRVAFSATAPQMRELADMGLFFSGRHFVFQ